MTRAPRAGIARVVRRRTIAGLVSLGLVVALATSCERDEPAPARSAAEPPETPAAQAETPAADARRAVTSHDARFTSRCALGEPTSIASGLGPLHGVAIAIGDTSQMVVGNRDRDTLLAMATRVAAGAEPVAIALPGADEIFAIEPIDGERFVVITHARCPEGVQSTRCLAARLLGPDARALSDVAIIELGGPLRSVRVDASGDAVWIARTSAGAQPSLDRLEARESSLAVSTRALGDGVDVTDEPTEILGLAVSGGSWAVLWRHGATEDACSGVMLSTQLDEHEVEVLQEALVLDSLQWYAGSLSMVAALEFARPVFVRIGPDGEVRGEPRPLPPGERLPQPFATRRSAAILGTGPSASIEVRDGSGDAIAPRVPLVGVVHADVARRGDTFVVALARRDAEGTFAIETRELRCESVAATR